MDSSMMPPPPPRPPLTPAPSAETTESKSRNSSLEKDTVLSDGAGNQPQPCSEMKSHEARDGVDAVDKTERHWEDETEEKVDVKKQAKGEENVLEEGNASNSIAKVRFSSSVYSIPQWSATPAFPFSLEVIKDGALIGSHDVFGKGAYMFGRSDQCDFILEHPSISRFHAVVQFKRPSDVFIYDLGSTHGTIVNKKPVTSKTYIPLHVGDVLKFGLSSRLYVLQGPDELMPKEKPTKAQIQLLQQSETFFELAERDASLQRAKRDADGVSWGMMEDAFENETLEEEEITWQTYKGQLTEKQQKTLEKIQKRNEKISSLKKEIDAIQVKEIPQGGLTQGQQSQVARNQQRIEQLAEELENLEETLNQSIQESVGARARKRSFGKEEKEENEDLSDDDDFYDCTNIGKAKPSSKKSDSVQVIETAETLLDKRKKISEDIEKLFELLHSEETNQPSVLRDKEDLDPLDAFMTDVSSKLESDRVTGLKKEIEKHQSDLDRINSLLRIADPTGEQEKNWQNLPHSNIQDTDMKKKTASDRAVERKSQISDEIDSPSKKNSGEKKETNTTMPTEIHVIKDKELVVKNGPLWLGQARKDVHEAASTITDIEDGKKFMEYKDRHKAKAASEDQESSKGEDTIPDNVSGLILRKKKDIGAPKEDIHDGGGNEEEDKRLWEGAAAAAADTVALLLRHQRGLGAAVEEEFQSETRYLEDEEALASSTGKKRKLGPEKPDFLNTTTKFQAWVPPPGQTGDGKTELNKKYGY